MLSEAECIKYVHVQDMFFIALRRKPVLFAKLWTSVGSLWFLSFKYSEATPVLYLIITGDRQGLVVQTTLCLPSAPFSPLALSPGLDLILAPLLLVTGLHSPVT